MILILKLPRISSDIWYQKRGGRDSFLVQTHTNDKFFARSPRILIGLAACLVLK